MEGDLVCLNRPVGAQCLGSTTHVRNGGNWRGRVGPFPNAGATQKIHNFRQTGNCVKSFSARTAGNAPGLAGTRSHKSL